MEVQIGNALDGTVHVAVVQHSPVNLEVIVSKVRVPIPSGTVLGHWDVEPGHALSMSNVDVETAMSLSLQGYDGGMSVTQIDGKKDGEPFRQLILRPMNAPDEDKSELN
jgi:hypothetical protein